VQRSLTLAAAKHRDREMRLWAGGPPVQQVADEILGQRPPTEYKTPFRAQP
jgi:hypothetical protein